MRHLLHLIAATVAFTATESTASTLAYQPQNPALFSGVNPGNSAALLLGVDRPKNPGTGTGASTLTASAIVEQSVLSQASQRINDQIFNSNPGDSGTFDLGGGTSVSYTNIAGVITLTVVDSHGTTIIGGF